MFVIAREYEDFESLLRRFRPRHEIRYEVLRRAMRRQRERPVLESSTR